MEPDTVFEAVTGTPVPRDEAAGLSESRGTLRRAATVTVQMCAGYGLNIPECVEEAQRRMEEDADVALETVAVVCALKRTVEAKAAEAGITLPKEEEDRRLSELALWSWPGWLTPALRAYRASIRSGDASGGVDPGTAHGQQATAHYVACVTTSEPVST